MIFLQGYVSVMNICGGVMSAQSGTSATQNYVPQVQHARISDEAKELGFNAHRLPQHLMTTYKLITERFERSKIHSVGRASPGSTFFVQRILNQSSRNPFI